MNPLSAPQEDTRNHTVPQTPENLENGLQTSSSEDPNGTDDGNTEEDGEEGNGASLLGEGRVRRGAGRGGGRRRGVGGSRRRGNGGGRGQGRRTSEEDEGSGQDGGNNDTLSHGHSNSGSHEDSDAAEEGAVPVPVPTSQDDNTDTPASQSNCGHSPLRVDADEDMILTSPGWGGMRINGQNMELSCEWEIHGVPDQVGNSKVPNVTHSPISI